MAGIAADDDRAAAFTPGKKRRQCFEPTPLHDAESFVDGDLPVALQNRATLRHFRRGVERAGFDDAVAARPLTDRSLGDGTIGLDFVHCTGKRIAGVDHSRSELSVPLLPLLQDPGLGSRRLRHAPTIENQQILRHSVPLLLGADAVDCQPIASSRSRESCARALSRRLRFAGSLSQRLWPEGCGRGTSTGFLPNVRPILSSSGAAPRNRAIAICPTRMMTSGSSISSSASSQCAQLATAAGGGRRSPVPARLRPGKQRISAAMYVKRRNSSVLEKPARSIQRSSSLPARPENGLRDSRSAGPGACPTKKNGAPHWPENLGLAPRMMPASTHTWQARHAAWRARSALGEPRGDLYRSY